MRLTVRQLDKVIILGLEGELTLVTAVECLREARRILESTSTPLVAMDLSRLRRIDASGCAAIIALRRDIQRRRGNLCLFGLGSEVRLLLEIMQVHLILDIASDVDGALAALDGHAGMPMDADPTRHWRGVGHGEERIERRAAG
jgi:anti-anti-sigma factor